MTCLLQRWLIAIWKFSAAACILRKIIISVEDDFKSKRISNDYLESAKKYINDIAKDKKLVDAFGTNYQIVMQMEKLNISVKDSFINAVNAIINIYNESEKLWIKIN